MAPDCSQGCSAQSRAGRDRGHALAWPTRRNPTAGGRMPREVATALAEGLSAAGVRMLFGVPGGGPNLDMIGAAAERDIDFVLTHGETAACIMAATYGRLTGTPGVAVVTRGPGMASASHGLAQATLDRCPLLLISDSVPRASANRV